MKCLFLDEAGNFDFSEKGTPFLMVCATLLDINATRSGELSCLRYELNAQGHDIESFHASANTPFVRGAFMRRLAASGPNTGSGRYSPGADTILADKAWFWYQAVLVTA